MDEETKLAATREVRRDGDRVIVSLPEEAVENSGLTVGDETMVAYRDDGPVVLVPWARDDVVDIFREDRGVESGDGEGADEEPTGEAAAVEGRADEEHRTGDE